MVLPVHPRFNTGRVECYNFSSTVRVARWCCCRVAASSNKAMNTDTKMLRFFWHRLWEAIVLWHQGSIAPASGFNSLSDRCSKLDIWR
jgi:hypothetical protein